jgi:hypothetical protein
MASGVPTLSLPQQQVWPLGAVEFATQQHGLEMAERGAGAPIWGVRVSEGVVASCSNLLEPESPATQ